jgi:single-strand DNA-binding protein
MANLNKVFLIGRLTRDPETRNISTGTAVVTFGLAVNRVYTNRTTNEKVEETTFVDVEAWGRQGETIARYTQKGRQILIEGRLKFDSWERDGQRRTRLSVVCEGFQFMDGGSRGASERTGTRPEGRSSEPPSAPVGARETPQDDYADDDIPF